jgi:hypothetical protein
MGAMAGSAAYSGAWAGTQQQFDTLYYACMYSLGHKVPVPANDVARYRTWFDSAAARAEAAATPLPSDRPPPDYRPPAPLPPPPR